MWKKLLSKNFLMSEKNNLYCKYIRKILELPNI